MKSLLIMVVLLAWAQSQVQASTTEPSIEGSRPPSFTQSKQLWAQSYLYAKAPDFVVEKWLGNAPDMAGKYILIEFWATWCSACRRAQPLMNSFHENFGEEMVIIGISDESEEKLLPYIKEKNIQYYMAIDTQARMKDHLGIWGIPHVIIIEPNGFVIWEGFPLLKDYELNEATIQRILEIGRSQEKTN